MADPIGLTRAEEAQEQQQSARKPPEPAPPGVARCRIPLQPSGDACPAAAKFVVVWPDNERTPACFDCGERMVLMAKSHKTDAKLEPLR